MRYSSIRYEFEFETDVWTDVSAYVQGVDTGRMGFSGWGPLDRVASTGVFKFSLLNENHRFTPGHVNCTAGFQQGVNFRLVLAVGAGEYRTRFYGTVTGITLDVYNNFLITNVTVSDFIDQMARHELDLPTYVQDKRIDEVAPLIIANMPIAPLNTDYNTGQDTFTNVFDTVKSRTTALSEFSKVALSELGLVYLKHGDGDDECLVVDGRYTRKDASLATVSGDDAVFETDLVNVRLTHSDYYYNYIKTITYPREVDSTATTVLFTLNQSVAITSGATVYITGRFIDPNQEAVSVTGVDMVTPVATTDYLFNTASDGGGSNITADLDVTATYGTNGVEYELTNNNASTGYVTFLQARGKGVYTYRPVEYVQRNDTDITAYGKSILNLSMPYQDNPLVGEDFAGRLLDLYSTRRTVVESISLETSSTFLLKAFLELQVGDKIQIIVDEADIDSMYFIHGINFTIDPSGFVQFTYSVIEAALMPAADYWELDSATLSQLGETTVLGF